MVLERTVEYLNRLAQELYRKYWGLDLDISVEINPRMRKWSARYNKQYALDASNNVVGIEGKNIELSKFLVENYTDAGVVDSLKHELCHHACLSRNKPYTDDAEYFESELKRIDACSHLHTSEELIKRGHVKRGV